MNSVDIILYKLSNIIYSYGTDKDDGHALPSSALMV